MLSVIADKFGEPVVVNAEAIGLQPGVFQPEDAESQGRVQHVSIDPVDRIVLLPLGRVPAARPRVGIGRLGQEGLELFRALAGAEANADRVRRIAFIIEIGAFLAARRIEHQLRRTLAVFVVDPRHPQIGRLVNVRIGGDQAILGHGYLPRSGAAYMSAALIPAILLRSAALRHRFTAAEACRVIAVGVRSNAHSPG